MGSSFRVGIVTHPVNPYKRPRLSLVLKARDAFRVDSRVELAELSSSPKLPKLHIVLKAPGSLARSLPRELKKTQHSPEEEE
jgi:hypothetical protein